MDTILNLEVHKTKTVEKDLDAKDFDSEGSKDEKLTDWKNEPTVSDLKQDYTEASSDHDTQTSKIDRWLDNLNVTGTAVVKTPEGRSRIVPKLIRKQAEWRYAALSEPFTSTEDIFNVNPKTYEDVVSAEQNQLVLNNQFNTQINKIKFIDDYVRAAVNEGTVIVRVGWDFEEQEVKVPQPIFEVRPIADPAVAQQMLAVGQQPIEKVQVGIEMVSEMKTIKNQPTVEVCDYNDVTIDPTCQGDMEKANFVIFSFETSMSELEKDDKYVNLDNINIEANSVLNSSDTTDDETSFTFTDKPRKKIVAYEYWGFWDIDKTGMVKPIVATYVGDTMIRMEENPFPDSALPFVVVPYLPVRKSVYGEPDGELLEDNQKVVGAVTRGMVDTMGRSANGQMGSRKDALDITNKRKFDKGQDYEFNSQVDPKQAFHMHTYPEIPTSAQFMLQLQNNEAEALTGVKAFSGGITGNSLGDSVGGIKSAMDATAKRELGILKRLAEGMKLIGRKFTSMNAVFLDPEEVIRITNDEFVPVRRDDLEGNFDLRLEISTAEADNQKAEELSFMMQTVGNNLDPAMTNKILAEIAKLRKMPALAKEIEEFQPTPDPLEEKIKQLEIAKLEAEIAKIHSEAYENQAGGQLDQAKVGTEQAKAKDLNSTADRKDLDFVEEESGVNHARDMQKNSAQAEANARLKVIEGAVKNAGNNQNQNNSN